MWVLSRTEVNCFWEKNPFFCLSISSYNHLTAVFDFLPSVIIFLHLLFLIALCSSEYLSKGCISVHGLSCQMVELAFHLLVLLKSEQEKKKTSLHCLMIHVNCLSPETAHWGKIWSWVVGGWEHNHLMIGKKDHRQSPGLMTLIITISSPHTEQSFNCQILLVANINYNCEFSSLSFLNDSASFKIC